MDDHILFSAIGNVDDTYLAELESTPNRHIPRRFGLVAALIALLLTACAAPVILQQFDRIRTAVRSDTGHGCEIYVMVSGSRKWKYAGFRSYDAQIQITPNPDAPGKLETHYLPVELLNYCTPAECEITDTSISMNFSMKVPRYGEIFGIRYQQYVIPEDGNVTVPKILGYSYLEQDSRTYGNVNALIFHGDVTYPKQKGDARLTSDISAGSIYTQIIFWSDGNYLYCLKLPLTYNLPITAVEKIVTSLTAVEDVSSYITAG